MNRFRDRATRLLFIMCGVLIAIPFGALASNGEFPWDGDRSRLVGLESLDGWHSSTVDVAGLLREDASNRGRSDMPLRVGYPMAVDLSPENSGTWEELPRGDRLWRLKVVTEDALWTVLGFDRFRLQQGGSLSVYEPTAKTVLGPYSAADIRKHGELWFPPIKGDTLIVELYWPKELAGIEPALHLGTVSHGYKPFGAIGRVDSGSFEAFGDSGSCNIDVACPEGDAWQDQSRGVVVLLSGGSGVCTGSLINTTADDCRTYVLTAAHCNAGASMTIGFNFELPGCGTGTPPSETNQTLSGATVLANFSSSDFTLLEMDQAPPEEYGAYFNGWSRDPAPAQSSYVIHHPSGDVKKISHDADSPVDGTNYGPNHWRIDDSNPDPAHTSYEWGTTEPGSSGSPLFDDNQRIIGQLHGGTASCSSDTWDEYGKVDASWVGGGTASNRMSDWLDPEGTGALMMDGRDHSICLFQPVGTILFTRDLYSCADTLAISLRDDNIPGTPATIDVSVSSASEVVPETVTLTQIEPGGGRYLGTISTTDETAANGDGLLSVSHGDMITVNYVDADDGAGGTDVTVKDNADIDCSTPLISNVQSSDVAGTIATVTWDTNEPADSSVTVGTAPPGDTTTSDPALVLSHSVGLSGLQECTDHFFSVGSVDAVGNAASDDNLGSSYTFKTGRDTIPAFASMDTPISIVDNTTITSTVTVVETETVLDVDVRLNATHTYDGDLDIFLIGPDGTRVELTSDNGGTGENFIDTVFDDEADSDITAGSAPYTGSFRPEGSLATLDGLLAAGNWTLEVTDDATADQGQLADWTLILTFQAQACGAEAELVSYLLRADTCTSGSAGAGNARWDAGEVVEFSLDVKNTGTEDVTAGTVQVTPLTAGVTMLDGDASVGDIAPGATVATQSPHVIAQLAESLVCGGMVEFQVDIVSNEGAWSTTTQQMIGETIAEEAGVSFEEDFAGGLPAGWTVVDGLNDGSTWFSDNSADPAGCGSTDPVRPIDGNWAAVDSSCASGGTRLDEELITPTIDLTGRPVVTLQFDHWFAWEPQRRDEIGDVDVRSTLTGGQWVNVARFAGASTANPQREVIDLSAFAGGASDLEIRWHYYEAQRELYWYVDNVEVRYSVPGSCEMETCVGSPGGPPPIPDGSAGTLPLKADRLSLDGSQLQVDWDDQCSPFNSKIIYGPLSDVATLVTAGADCAVSTPHVWNAAPPGNIWFLVIGEDATGTESSWGQAAAGERNGLTSSGTCGSATKDVSGSCP